MFPYTKYLATLKAVDNYEMQERIDLGSPTNGLETPISTKLTNQPLTKEPRFDEGLRTSL